MIVNEFDAFVNITFLAYQSRVVHVAKNTWGKKRGRESNWSEWWTLSERCVQKRRWSCFLSEQGRMRRLITPPSWNSVTMKLMKRETKTKGRARMTRGTWTSRSICSQGLMRRVKILNGNTVYRVLLWFSLYVWLSSSVSSRGPRTLPLQTLTPEPRTAAGKVATRLPRTLTEPHSPPPASQDGPRREAAAGETRGCLPAIRWEIRPQQPVTLQGTAKSGNVEHCKNKRITQSYQVFLV